MLRRRWLAGVRASLALVACAVPAMRIYPCDPEGTSRACTDTCGDGVASLQERLVGSLRACRPTASPCSDSCGEGTRLCQDDRRADKCEVAPVVEDCTSICGPGTRTCANNQWGACTAPQPKQPKLTAVIRDFHMTFPDVMSRTDTTRATGWDSSIVEDMLGADDKPVYAQPAPR